MDVKISADFRQMAIKAIISIVWFIIVYLLLFLAAIVLTVGCAGCGIALIVLKPMFFTLAVGIGLASTGFMVLFFLLKFVFKTHKVDRSGLTEITREEQPQLFAFIDDIAREVHTRSPKRVYLSSEVNASVFYDSSFWSMFFPVRKNLQIGMGLVNAVSVQEFKAILAHEFGHFSQKSMKVGSYVYNVNQVIYNLLYENEGFDRGMMGWARVSGYFQFFVSISIEIIKAIQSILKKMYDYVNVQYMALSRQMEFHADEIAANVAGSASLKNALLRLDLASYSYDTVLGMYNDKVSECIRSKNIFNEHRFVIQHIAADTGLRFENNLPVVTASDLQRFNKSKLNIKDQWASHPGIDERTSALDALNIPVVTPDPAPAISLFHNADMVERILTDKIFSYVEYKEPVKTWEVDQFKSAYITSYNDNSFDKRYNSYYDSKNPEKLDIASLESLAPAATFDDLYSKQAIDMVYELLAMEQDMTVLTAIENGSYPVKTFDYDGHKYNLSDVSDLLKKLQTDKLLLQEKIRKNDEQVFVYFHDAARKKGEGEKIASAYNEYYAFVDDFETKKEEFFKFQSVASFMNVQTPFNEIREGIEKLKAAESEFKTMVKAVMANEDVVAGLSASAKANLEKYLTEDLVYFGIDAYYDDAVNVFFEAVNSFVYLLNRSFFLTKKHLLELQMKYVGEGRR